MNGKLEDLGVDGRVILEYILKQNGRVSIGFDIQRTVHCEIFL
jgi:hypothetical protein